MGKGRGYSSGSAVAIKGWAGKAPTGPLMRFLEARNDKPPSGGNGGLTRLVGSLTLGMLVKRGLDYPGSSRTCQVHPRPTLGRSGRGNHAQDCLKSRPGRWASRRAACCWEARTTTGKPVKSCQQRMAPSVINSARLWVRRNSLPKPCGITISHRG